LLLECTHNLVVFNAIRIFIPGKNLIADLDFFNRAIAFAGFYK